MSNAEAGWYPDPNDAARMRYYDGEMWTDHYHDPQAPVAQSGGFVADGVPGAAATRQVGLTGPGELLSHAWSGMAARIGSLLGITVMTMVAVVVLYAIFFASIVGSDGNVGLAIIGFIILVVVGGLIYSCYLLMVCRTMLLHFRGHDVSMASAWAKTKTRMWALFGTAVALYIGLAIGFAIVFAILGAVFPPLIILSIPAFLFLLVKLGFLPIAAAATTPGESMVNASFGVSENRFWAILGRLIVLILPLFLINIVTFILFAVAGRSDSVALFAIVYLISLIVSFLGGLFMFSGMTKLYLDAGALSDI